METKRCCRCKETKPFSEFHKDRSGKCGLRSFCKKCCSEYYRKYRECNKEKIAKYQRRYREANKERQAEYSRNYYKNNREKAYERARRYTESNKMLVRRQNAKRVKEVNDRSLELAHRQGQPWEDWEEEFVMADNGLTDYQKAVKIGRSLSSITNRRYTLKKLVMS